MKSMKTAVEALALVVKRGAFPRILLDPRGGIRPETFREQQDVVTIHNPAETVRVLDDGMAKEALNHAINALSSFVERG